MFFIALFLQPHNTFFLLSPNVLLLSANKLRAAQFTSADMSSSFESLKSAAITILCVLRLFKRNQRKYLSHGDE
jgi:hypothetical protein